MYKSIADAVRKHPDADCLINFASLRSAKESTDEALSCPRIRTIAIIAEGIPENVTRKINKLAKEKGIFDHLSKTIYILVRLGTTNIFTIVIHTELLQQTIRSFDMIRTNEF